MGMRFLVFLSLFASSMACASPQRPTDAGYDTATDIFVPSDIATDTAPEAPPPFDAGPEPACTVKPVARHIIDRPGGDRVADPSSLLPVMDGFLVGLRRVDLSSVDGGTTDGGSLRPSRDSVELLPLDREGLPRSGTVTLYDGVPNGTVTDIPQLFPSPMGAFVVFQESRGNASDPNFLLRLRSTVVNASGVGVSPSVLRERYPRPVMTALASGNLLGVSARIDPIGDSGVVSATPMSMYLSSDGTNLRPQDVNINAFVPLDITDAVLRPAPDGGARMVFRTQGHMGFLRFDATGAIDARGVYEVRGATIPSLDDAAVAGDAVVGVWSRTQPGGRTEVHVVVASDRGQLRLDREIESYTGEGGTVATAVRAYGGVAILWRRGVDTAARVRVAVVQPDGVVRVSPTDLVAAPGVEGRIVAVTEGRKVSFVVRDVQRRVWGYTFGTACIPAH